VNPWGPAGTTCPIKVDPATSPSGVGF